MKEEDVWKLLERSGAILRNDHFVYKKDGHGHEYINKDALFMRPYVLGRLCEQIALKFVASKADVVLAPAVGGALIAQWVAYHLHARTIGTEVLALYADKEGGGFVLKRGYDAFVPGKNVLVVEDILNTGSSVKQIVELTRELGGNVVGVGAICNRGSVTAEAIGDPPILYSVASVDMQMFDAAACPFCAEGRPINTKIGHGADFVAKHGQPKVPA